MSNRLANETSPYLLQHAENPVDWYPWCDEAFSRAKEEAKPIFLSIGYSTCHWCHIMARESFEDKEIAKILNRHFISIKVDREERPDVDSVYMSVCQALTGSGGWPTSIFMTPDKKPFFAGTYFPKSSRGGMLGFYELLAAVYKAWENDREALVAHAEGIISRLSAQSPAKSSADARLLDRAADIYNELYDAENGGFGRAPKFPAPHNLLFLLTRYDREGDLSCLNMAEHTLRQMYRGGIFDHIGGGFCRYSTDARFLAPHFEKMLYDNALLILAYSKAYAVTKKPEYLYVAEKTAAYILREMTSPEGGYYSAQDADSDGEEGKYYLFTPEEVISVLGEDDGAVFNRRYDITARGNFAGKSIPNLLKSKDTGGCPEAILDRLRAYRKKRCSLRTDDKILTAWNSLMIAAMCELCRVSGKSEYLSAAVRAEGFINERLRENNTLYVSIRDGKRGANGFLDDYAAYIFAELHLYAATFEPRYLHMARRVCDKALAEFSDEGGGFFLYGKDSESLFMRPKETYDGAIPSGNSLMAWNLVRLGQLTGEERYINEAERQLDFLSAEAARYPAGCAMYLIALLDHYEPPAKITVVLKDESEQAPPLPKDAVAVILRGPTGEYPLKAGRTTYYVCKGHTCLPPVNDLSEAGIIPDETETITAR